MHADMAGEALCSVQESACSNGARNLRRIVEEARTHEGLARIGHINRAINLAIKPTATAYWQSALETLSAVLVTAKIIQSQSTCRCGKPVSANAM
jgi:hypothetical protein